MDKVISYFFEDLVPNMSTRFQLVLKDIQEVWDYIQEFFRDMVHNILVPLKIWLEEQPALFHIALALGAVCLLYSFVIWPITQDYFLAEGCRLVLENSEPLKIGDSVVCTITGFVPSTTKKDTSIETYTQRIFNGLTANVELDRERIPAMKAYAEEDCSKIKMAFTVIKSGTYIVGIRYNGFIIPGSPFEITVSPDFLCPVNSDVVFPSTPVILTDYMPQMISISPNDRSGQPCSAEGVRLDKFDFHASTEKVEEDPCGATRDIIGCHWKECLDASFTYEGSSVAQDRKEMPVKVLLILRTSSTHSYGMFEGHITYDGELLKSGSFPIVALRSEEYERLEPTLKEAKPSDVIQLRAEIVQPLVVRQVDLNNATQDDGSKEIEENKKEVYLYISMKFICIKEVVWSVLLSRSALYPIHGDTKVQVSPENEQKRKYIVTITDGSQNEMRLLMSASNTRMLMALYLKFRESLLGGALTYSEKVENFFDYLKLRTTKAMPFDKENYQLLKISRPDAVITSYEEARNFDAAKWYNPFIVSFVGEPLLEGEASYLEWSEMLLDIMLENNPLGMFNKISDVSGYLHPNPSRNSRRWRIQYYELAGKVIGKYLIERAMNTNSVNYTVKVRFSRSFLQQLIGSAPNANSLERDMPEFYESTLTTLTKSTLSSALLTFAVPEYDIYGRLDRMVPIIENGESVFVTSDNVHLYLNALANYKLACKVTREIQAFRAGFTFLVPEDLLLNFDENELELLICGWSKLDLRDLKKCHKLIGEHHHPQLPRIVKWFWNSLADMSQVDQAKFLQFCTGSSVLPLGGFAQLKPQLVISMTCLYGQLPAADPSSHAICLSDHPDFEAFHSALLTAVRTSACCQTRPKRCGQHDGDQDQD